MSHNTTAATTRPVVTTNISKGMENILNIRETLREEMEEFRRSLYFTNEEVQNLKTLIKEQNERINVLEKKNSDLHNRNKNLELHILAQQNQQEFEQNFLSSHLKIAGIPKEGKENVKDVMDSVAGALGGDSTDVQDVRRIGINSEKPGYPLEEKQNNTRRNSWQLEAEDPPPYYGHPRPHAPGAYTYTPTPAMVPVYPPPPQSIPSQPTYVTNHYYPSPPVPEPVPTPVTVVESPTPISTSEMIDWAPATTSTATSLKGSAYVGGREGWDDSRLWIIRAHHSGHLVPGKLAIKHRCAFIPFAGNEVPVHNFEVLCAPANALRWVAGSNGNVPPGAIAAGNTPSAEPLYIGRVRHRGSKTPGKIHPSHGCCYISFGGCEVSYKHYEVLCRTSGY